MGLAASHRVEAVPPARHGKIAVKVINDDGDEVVKVFEM